jgi:DNA invertase Pin-like site-specific DNA recombinase
MLKFLKDRNDIPGIIAWKLNRLSRNPIDSGTLQWLLQSGKIIDIVTPGRTFTEMDSDFVMAFEGADASRFIRNLREDTKRGVESKIQKGIAPQLAPPGYRNSVEKRQGERDIEIDQGQFPLMREIFDLALTGKWSINNLTEKAEELGLHTNGRSKGPISRSRIAEILHDPFYTGRFSYKGIPYEGIHTPLISQAEFDALQVIFKSRYTSKTKYLTFPLSTVVKCVCGRGLVGEAKKVTYKNGKEQSFIYYRCSRQKYPFAGCPRSRISHKDLEEQATALLGKIRISQRMADFVIKQLNEESAQQKALQAAQSAALSKKLVDVRKKLDNLFDLKLSSMNIEGSLITDEEYA